MLDSKMASIPTGPEQANTGETRMVFPVNTSVLECRCHAGRRAAQSCVCTGAIKHCVYSCTCTLKEEQLVFRKLIVGQLVICWTL